MIRTFTLAIFILLFSGCSIVDSLVYKLPKQQGNITEYEGFEKLEIGMNKAQVQFIMGTPMATYSFDKDRWDYAYTYKSIFGDETRNIMTLYFIDGKLSKIDGVPLIKRPEEKNEITGQTG